MSADTKLLWFGDQLSKYDYVRILGKWCFSDDVKHIPLFFGRADMLTVKCHDVQH